MSIRKREMAYPSKGTMNLYYKIDRTSKPATISLYVLFVLVVLLALAKVMVYDLWVKVDAARQEHSYVESQLTEAMFALQDYDQVQEKYNRYSATEEELALIDRMEVLNLLDSAVGTTAQISNVSVSGSTVTMQFSGVTLAQTAQIVSRLEESPIVLRTAVSTASTSGYQEDLVMVNIQIQLQKDGQETEGVALGSNEK